VYVCQLFIVLVCLSGLMKVLETVEGKCEEVLASWSRISEFGARISQVPIRGSQNVDISPFWGR
jgi:hypothetical protein